MNQTKEHIDVINTILIEKWKKNITKRLRSKGAIYQQLFLF